MEAPTALTFAPDDQSGHYKGNHSTAAFFHVIFKLLALLCYVFGSVLFGGSYVLLFVIVVLLLAADFWTVKNVTGRMMVALRWWNEIQDNGTNVWRFEAGDINLTHSFDATFFWAILFGHVIIWVVNLVAAFLGSWKYLPLVLIALVLGGANAVGYSKCRKDARKRLEAWIAAETVDILRKNPEMVTAAALNSMGTVKDAFNARFGSAAV